MPYDVVDIGWYMENSYHFLGDPVPLVRNRVLTIIECGGLLFTFNPESESLFVVQPGVTVAQLMESLGPRAMGVTQTTKLKEDGLAANVGSKYDDMWNWERKLFGRNRWVELQARGGDVHSSLLENLPMPFCF